MRYKVVISKSNKVFPIKGLNELLAGRIYDYRTKKYRNSVKSDNDSVCCVAIKKYLNGAKLKTPIRCTYNIYVPNKMHDRGNVYSAVEKSFLDALQKCNAIETDGFDYVLDSEFHTVVDKDFPRVEVFIDCEVSYE